MNRYESVIIINPTLNEEERKETLNKYEMLMKGFSNKKVEVEDLGEKKLAYEIQNNKTGYYVVFKFHSEPEKIAELERNYRIDDNVMKFITVRMEEQAEFSNEEEEEEEY